jgi:hypothetical protein
MLKIALIVAATAVPAFGVGWTASTMAHPRLAGGQRRHLPDNNFTI